jgi:hypothetical protein
VSYSIRVNAPNSVLLLMDPQSADIPETMAGGHVAATESCIAIGTISELDGSVLVEVLDERHGNRKELHKLGDWSIRVQNSRLAVCSIHLEELLSIRLQSTVAKLELWANDLVEPDHIVVVLCD